MYKRHSAQNIKKKCSCMVQPNKWTIAPLLLRLHVRVDNGQGRSGPGPKTPFDPIHGGGEVKSISNRFFSFVQTDLSPMKSWVCGTIFFFLLVASQCGAKFSPIAGNNGGGRANT
jgi:hypothetical protein